MKRRTFYHLSLVLPYLALAVSLALLFVTGAMDDFFNSPASLEILFGVLAFFGITGFVWGPLYTWMVVVMLIWSRGRKTEDVRRLYLLSPLLLACSMGIPAVVSSIPYSIYFFVDGFLRMNNMGYVSSALLKNLDDEMMATMFVAMVVGWFFMAGICIVVGYVFVGVVVWLEKMMGKRGWFRDETGPHSETPLPREAISIVDKDQIQQAVDGDSSLP